MAADAFEDAISAEDAAYMLELRQGKGIPDDDKRAYISLDLSAEWTEERGDREEALLFPIDTGVDWDTFWKGVETKITEWLGNDTLYDQQEYYYLPEEGSMWEGSGNYFNNSILEVINDLKDSLGKNLETTKHFTNIPEEFELKPE